MMHWMRVAVAVGLAAAFGWACAQAPDTDSGNETKVAHLRDGSEWRLYSVDDQVVGEAR